MTSRFSLSSFASVTLYFFISRVLPVVDPDQEDCNIMLYDITNVT